MRAHRLEVTVPPSGELQLTQLPFQPGEAVEIIMLALKDAVQEANPMVEEAAPTQLPRNKKRQAKRPQRQATLLAIQQGKYAQLPASGALLPSEAFAGSKAAEKAREERRWGL